MTRQHLKEARKRKGWTALHLAEHIGATEEHVYQVERGRYGTKPETAERWADALDMDPPVAFPEIFGQPVP
ncbi:MAG: XRE family transcriptional regulator [Spartobacteria bacterium]|jgi:DNA-binding XRE family transcriptional regulator|nr:XRE family transcriptional regulator [Spartobacteria bacterium]